MLNLLKRKNYKNQTSKQREAPFQLLIHASTMGQSWDTGKTSGVEVSRVILHNQTQNHFIHQNRVNKMKTCSLKLRKLLLFKHSTHEKAIDYKGPIFPRSSWKHTHKTERIVARVRKITNVISGNMSNRLRAVTGSDLVSCCISMKQHITSFL